MRAIICDLDGTLANVSHRLHHLDGEKDWKAFHDGMHADSPVEAIRDLLQIVASAQLGGEQVAVLIVTARHDDPLYQGMTSRWLEENGVPVTRLYMRADGDFRSDVLVKQDILAQILEEGFVPFLAIDDREEIVRMWEDHGITTFKVGEGVRNSPYAGQTLLHMLVGPSGSGKSTYAQVTYKEHEIISSDALRLQMFGRLDNSPEAQIRVWKLINGMIRARLEAGCFTVLDATNLRLEDRKKALSLLPRGVFARYIVIDRRYDEKLKCRGERSEELLLKHDKAFRRELQAILAGDHHPYVTVQDKRA